MHTLIHKCLLNPDKKTVVGVSGGPDSQVLISIIKELGFMSVIAHFNHKLRPEADSEEEIVKILADQYGMEFYGGQEDVYKYAKEFKLSLEEAARKSRYRFLFMIARKLDAQAVAIAHNADDQVETFLMHLMRGSGLSGLKGMEYRTDISEFDESIPIVRPLLGIWRNEIIDYCDENNIKPVFDESNSDITFFRNRLRNELIPYLGEYNPNIKETIWRTANIVSEDISIISTQVDKAWDDCLVSSGQGFIEMNVNTILEQPLGLQRWIIRKAISKLRPGLRDIDFYSIDRANHFIKIPSSTGKIDLISNLELVYENERIFFKEKDITILDDKWPSISVGENFPLNVPGRIDLNQNWVISTQYIKTLPADQSLLNPYSAYLDASHLVFPLVIRTRIDGDRFQPLGLGGKSQKLSDFMINIKMPKRARENWPLFLSGERIIWVPGYRPAEFCKIRPESDHIIYIQLERK